MDQTKTLTLIRVDPHFGLSIEKETTLEIYEILHRKRYRYLTPYMGSKIAMTVVCPFGHTWGVCFKNYYSVQQLCN